MKDARNFYINGAWVAPIDGSDQAVINPSTEDPFAVISLGGAADTNAAVAAAKSAFPTWSQTSKDERLSYLQKILDNYNARADEMSHVQSQEMGAPMDLAENAQTAIGRIHIEAFMETLAAFEFEKPVNPEAPNDRLIYEPIGVCGLITPWNWPMNQVTLKVIAALAAGCTMVLKPSEESPLSAMLFAEMVHDAGLPAGVFNLVNGDGPGVGSQLTAHEDVDMISFTGSTRAGRLITKSAADTIKRVTLELGGKGANIIFEDADAEAVTQGALLCFENTGQSCNAPTRMLVHRSRYDQAVKEAKAAAEAQEVNLASNRGEHIGPLVNAVQFGKVNEMIDAGIKEGATLVAGGSGRPAGFNKGYFVRPTVFADCNNDMSVMRNEIFGPVLSMMPFDTEEEAIEIANDTPYGLTNYVQTQDPERARRVARQLRSGMVELNGEPLNRRKGAPFGGYKQSGNGREGGVWGIEDFLEVKAVGGWEATSSE